MSKPARLLCPWGFSRQEYRSGLPCPPPGDLPNPGITPRSPALQADSLLSEPPRRPKNTGMGSLSLLQGNFLIQELTQGLLHCWRILYQLSFLGNPKYKWGGKKPAKENVISFYHKCVITDALLTELYPLTQKIWNTASDHRFTLAITSRTSQEWRARDIPNMATQDLPRRVFQGSQMVIPRFNPECETGRDWAGS